jgi:hypothetical protein
MYIADSGRSITAWNLNIEQDNVRPQFRGQGNRVFAIPGLPYYSDVVLRLENPTKPLANERMIVHEQHGDRNV